VQSVPAAVCRKSSLETKALIDKLLLERLSLAAIARVSGVSKQWLQTYVKAKYAAVEQVAQVPVQKNDN
jgi:transposase